MTSIPGDISAATKALLQAQADATHLRELARPHPTTAAGLQAGADAAHILSLAQQGGLQGIELFSGRSWPTLAQAYAHVISLLPTEPAPWQAYERAARAAYHYFFSLPEDRRSRIWQQFLALTTESIPTQQRKLKAGTIPRHLVIAALMLDQALWAILKDTNHKRYLPESARILLHAWDGETWTGPPIPLIPDYFRELIKDKQQSWTASTPQEQYRRLPEELKLAVRGYRDTFDRDGSKPDMDEVGKAIGRSKATLWRRLQEHNPPLKWNDIRTIALRLDRKFLELETQ
jgi:hypothetical protein